MRTLFWYCCVHLALKVLGVKENDHVLCPSLTFAASANAIIYQNAIPVFIDSCPKTWTIDLDALEIAIHKFKPKALVAVDLYGQSADYDQINDLCTKNNVAIKKGQYVSTGTCAKPINFSPGDKILADYGKFGQIYIIIKE